MDFVLISPELSRETCEVDGIQGYDDDFMLLGSEPLAAEFPEDTFYVLDAKVMKSAKLKLVVQGDLLRNLDSVLLASPELAEVLVEAMGNAERLPTVVYDAKKETSKPYVIVHHLQTYDVISTPKDQLRFNTLDDTALLMEPYELEFDFSSVPDHVNLLLATGLEAVYLARRSWAEDLAARFSGICIDEIDG